MAGSRAFCSVRHLSFIVSYCSSYCFFAALLDINRLRMFACTSGSMFCLTGSLKYFDAETNLSRVQKFGFCEPCSVSNAVKARLGLHLLLNSSYSCLIIVL